MKAIHDSPELHNDVDFYGHRLAAVNEKNTVRANEDIVNSDGVLLLSKGSNFTTSKADLIAKHKLIKPLEHSVDIDKSLDGEQLFELLTKFYKTLPGLASAIDGEESIRALRSNCDYYGKFPLLRQKLTVLSNQLPSIYFSSLYSAIACTALSTELNLNDQQRRILFISGLMHNSGFLHLDPELTENEASLEKDDSLRVQAHPIIAKHFLDHVEGLPKAVGETVADHHERTDGTGYPKNKFGTELTIESQILAFTDTVLTAYNRCTSYGEHARYLMHVILQLNHSVHFESVYKAATRLIRRQSPAQTPIKNIPQAKALITQQKRITETFDATKKLAFILMNNTRSWITKSMASMLGRIATSIISAGISQEQYLEWLNQLSQEHNTEDEMDLVKSQLMLDEIETQIEHFKSIIWRAIKEIPENEETLLKNVLLSYNQIAKLKTKDYS